MKLTKFDFYIVATFVVVILLTRTIFSIAPNIEFVTALSFGAAYFLRNKYVSVIALFLSLFISDLFIGNTNIYLFTWSGFLIPIIFGLILSSSRIQNILGNINIYLKNFLLGINVAFLSSVIFFLWTNLGVVMTTTMYTRNFEGVIQSYVNALPFLKNQMLGNLVLVPLFVVMITYFTKVLKVPTGLADADVVQNNKALHN